MYIVKQAANEFGYRPAIQTWDGDIPPAGYVEIPLLSDRLLYQEYSGFVNLVIENTVVTGINRNEDAYRDYVSNLPKPEPTDIQMQRSIEIKSSCAAGIIAGFDADVLNRGTLHYTLTEIQQKDLESRYRAIQSGATEVLWHDSSRVTHETYTAAQFTSLFNAAQRHIISCKIRSDWLEQLAHDLIDAGKYDEALAITWDTILPEEYQTKCDAQITMIMQPYTT